MDSNIILGKTKNKFVKIDVKEMTTVKNCIFPKLDLKNCNEFDKNFIQDDKDSYTYIDLTSTPDIMNNYIECLNSTSSCNLIELDDFNKLQYIFIGEKNENNSWNISFQRLYPRFYFNKPTISFDKECTLKEPSKIIILDTKTDVFYDGINKKVYFKDFTRANKIINLMDFYREATIEDFKIMQEISIIDFNIEQTKLSKRCGKKIAQMIDEKVFERISIEQILEYAAEYNQELPISSENKIQITKNSDIELLFDIVEERFFTKKFSNEKCKTNSYKIVNKG